MPTTNIMYVNYISILKKDINIRKKKKERDPRKEKKTNSFFLSWQLAITKKETRG